MPFHGAGAVVVHPFLHAEPDRIHNPLTGLELPAGESGYATVRALMEGRTAIRDLAPRQRAALAAEGWLVPARHDAARDFRLRFVSLELHSACNDACYFCPVSVAPRAREQMPDALVDSILDQLAAHRDTIEAVFMNNYNEPTLDRRFVDHVAALKARGLPVALLTNGSGLSPARTDAIVALGGLRYVCVNLSDVDPERYRRQRGSAHLPVVLRNLEHAAQHPLAMQMEIVVLGEQDADHDRAFAAVRERFAGTRFTVRRDPIMDRAGYFSFGARPAAPHRVLRGCQNVGSRPLEHVHITASGRCVFCCEDYDERYVVGDLRAQTLDEVLTGDELARLRRLSYGLEEAAEDFICRHCVFARSGNATEPAAPNSSGTRPPSSLASS